MPTTPSAASSLPSCCTSARRPRRLRRTARMSHTLTRPPLRAAYSTVQGPDAVLIRPHPALWRLWHGVGVTYMLFLVFLLFQTPAGARAFMKVWLQPPRSLLVEVLLLCAHAPLRN